MTPNDVLNEFYHKQKRANRGGIFSRREIIEAMKRYADTKCAEQRDLIIREFSPIDTREKHLIERKIWNAPSIKHE